jgi:hypothetical protein
MIQRARTYSESAVRSHLQALEISSRLTTYFRQSHQPKATQVTPERVIEVLHGVGIKPVLMGTHGLGGWRDEPRASQDVDVLVRKKDFSKTIRALQEEYPKLTLDTRAMMTRFMDPATRLRVIDVLAPAQQVCQLIFRHTIPVGKTYLIPDLEMALAAKFAAMLSPTCEMSMKYLHAGDLYNVVGHNRGDISVTKLRHLAAKVIQGGGAKIGRLVEGIDAGRMIQW